MALIMADGMTLFAPSQRRRHRYIAVGLVGLIAVSMLLRASFIPTITNRSAESPSPIAKAFIVASLENDDTSWLRNYFSDWKVNRYIVDNPSAQFTVPKNKGREAMAYLTYMINAYDNLPDIMVFMHSQRYQWHNDDPIYDGVALLEHLQLSHIISEGYANLRCVWTLGCPSELNLGQQIHDDLKTMKSTPTAHTAYPQAFQELFPSEPIPSVVGVACCAQFAVTREKIRERPLQDYQRYRQWLLDTSLDNQVSGRIFEYSWHLIFGKPPVHCPSAKECYCNTFGLCNLECEGETACGQRWLYPPYATLPKGWPEIGWDGESRNQ